MDSPPILRKTHSDPTKKINVRLIRVKPASNMWINDDITGWKISGKEESLVEKMAPVTSSQHSTPSKVKTKVLPGESSVNPGVVVADPTVKQAVAGCLEVNENDSEEDKVEHIHLKQNKPKQRKSILKIPSDLSSARLNPKTEQKPLKDVVPPRSIQVRSYNQESPRSVIGFDLNSGQVLKEGGSNTVVIHHSKSTPREFQSGHCPALDIYFGNKGASCSNIPPNNQFSLNHQLKPDAKFSVNRNKSWKAPEPLETKTKVRGKKKKSKREKKEGKVNYTPVERFVEPTDEELKGNKKKYKNVLKMLTKMKPSSSRNRGVTIRQIDQNNDGLNNVDRKDKFK